MKSRFWLLILAALLLVCVALSLWLLWPAGPAAQAEIWSDGVLVKTVSLTTDDTFPVESKYGTNTVTVRNGKIAVTQASCPDHYCMERGFCDSGVQIVCLPNRLVIKFVGEQPVDGVVG